jgi:hypothetical protein
MMSNSGKVQRCAVCAWRGTCAKKFSVADGGARCPDFSRDVSIKDSEEAKKPETSEGKGA